MTVADVKAEMATYATLEAEKTLLARALTLDTGLPVDTVEIRIIGRKTDNSNLTVVVDAKVFVSSILSAITTRKSAVESAMSVIESHY